MSGRPCLDLLGTLKWRRRDESEEQLTAPVDLARWAVAAGLVDAPMSVTAKGLRDAIALRESTYRVVLERIGGGRLDIDAVEFLNGVSQGKPLIPKLGADSTVSRAGSSAQLLATLGADALDLLGSPNIGRVRECGDPDCTRLFLDQSRGRPRRWCGMSECGNRAKVDAYRHRQQIT